jgi:hypothetical protein
LGDLTKKFPPKIGLFRSNLTGATHFFGGKDPDQAKDVCQNEVESAEKVRCT